LGTRDIQFHFKLVRDAKAHPEIPFQDGDLAAG